MILAPIPADSGFVPGDILSVSSETAELLLTGISTTGTAVAGLDTSDAWNDFTIITLAVIFTPTLGSNECYETKFSTNI